MTSATAATMPTMTLRGTIFRRNGRIDARIIQPRQRPDRRIVGTSRQQGYNRKRRALIPLAHLLLNGPHTVYDLDGTLVPSPNAKPTSLTHYNGWKLPTRPYVGRVVRGNDGKFEWEIRSNNGNLVYSSHGQGYNTAGRVKPDGTVTKGSALATLVEVCHNVHEIDDTLVEE